jgi:hypothetical protein
MCRENLIKIRQGVAVLYMKTHVHLYLAEFFMEGEMFETKFVEVIQTRIQCLP